jgi:hypothetical protein
MAFTPGFALADGSRVDVFLDGADLGEALVAAQTFYGRHTRVSFQGDLGEIQRGGGESYTPFGRSGYSENASLTPASALRSCGLPRIDLDEAMHMSIAEAHLSLLPYFKVRTVRTGATPKSYDTPALMRRAFITTNSKMRKALPGVAPGHSRGPALLPHKKAAELSTLPLPLRGNGLCAGSNKACRGACLLHSGQNPMADAATPAKLSRTESLLLEPVAWVRMMAAAIEWHRDWCIKRKLVPYVRLNPLSDIPWELFVPGLTEAFPAVTFYDYTKVPSRQPGPGYDLTFSFSGTNGQKLVQELGEERRVAVVFLLPRPCGRYKAPCSRVDELTFLGRPVLDGNKHDFRPLDPPGAVVGLTFKPVHVGGTWHMEPPTGSEKMVIPAVRDTDTGALIVPATPAQLGGTAIFE